MEAWDAIGELLDAGRSWSGRERNGCFLNLGDGHFAAVAGLVGLDHDSDSRGLALVDWDRDGDLDLWLSNRTGPRIRYLRNDLVKSPRSVGLRLEGTRSNRDAIGARVTIVRPDGSSSGVWRSLRAGEGYLAQSSKWLTLPVVEPEGAIKVRVRWPNGSEEKFSGLRPNQRYELQEGSGMARVVSIRGPALPETMPPFPSLPTDSARIVPHAPLPLPRLKYFDLSGREQLIKGEPSSMLLTLWATWCGPCLHELKALQAGEAQLREAGVDWVPLNVDTLEEALPQRLERVRRFNQRHRLSARGGLATGDLVEILDAVQRSIVGRQKAIPVPATFLLDGDGRVSLVYKGRVSLDQILHDVAGSRDPNREWRDWAVAFPGRWYVSAFGTERFALPEKLLEIGQAKAAFSYLQRHLGPGLARRAVNDRGETLAAHQVQERDQRIGSLYERTGELFARKSELDSAIDCLESALVFLPDSLASRINLATALQSLGRDQEAVGGFRKVLSRQPDHVGVKNSLAWILATASEAAVRDPAAALELARQVCEATGNQEPQTLDTLAAALAATGRYEEAVSTAERALSLVRTKPQAGLAALLEQRLALYRNRQAFFLSGPAKK